MNRTAIFSLLIGFLAGGVPAIALPPPAAAEDVAEPVRFVFAGHVRGPFNDEINELLPYFVEEVTHLKKDFVLIAGDIICGYKTAYEPAALHREWDLVDRYLDRLGAPVYRVAGNHDWHSAATRDVFHERYGRDYFEFRSGYVSVIGLNTTRLVPDPSLDWAGIWTSNAVLPNVPEIPHGEQRDFLTAALDQAGRDPQVRHVVIFMSAPLWEGEGTRAAWWADIHPLLKETGKVRMVLAGEAGAANHADRVRDGVHYLASAWPIVGKTDDDFAPVGGAYLHVVLRPDSEDPWIGVRPIHLDPANYNYWMRALPPDTARYIDAIKRLEKGEALSFLNRARASVKKTLLRHVHWFDRRFNLVVLTAAAILAVVVFRAFGRGGGT